MAQRYVVEYHKGTTIVFAIWLRTTTLLFAFVAAETLQKFIYSKTGKYRNVLPLRIVHL